MIWVAAKWLHIAGGSASQAEFDLSDPITGSFCQARATAVEITKHELQGRA